MCQNCRYTHAREMGCRPPETIWRREDWHCFKTASSRNRDESTREILSPVQPARTPKKKPKKRSRAAPKILHSPHENEIPVASSRESVLPSLESFESPQENQVSSTPSREKEPVHERLKKKVSWPPDSDLEKVEEVSRWMSDAWGKFKDRWKWMDGKFVNEGWVKETEVQTPIRPARSRI